MKIWMPWQELGEENLTIDLDQVTQQVVAVLRR
jgi:hypothetical protein